MKKRSPATSSPMAPPLLDQKYVQDGLRGWASWRLEVTGQVKKPRKFSLTHLKRIASRTQITRDDCVQGWSAIAKWKGVPFSEVMKVVQPNPVETQLGYKMAKYITKIEFVASIEEIRGGKGG